MELAVRNLGRINEEIWALVDGVKDLVEVMKRKEASEMDGDQEVVEAGVQMLEELVIERVDKETEMERMEEVKEMKWKRKMEIMSWRRWRRSK
jgi:hypothetical protein